MPMPPEAHPGTSDRTASANIYLVVFSGIMAISTGAIFARLADAPALVIAAYRVGLATLILSPYALVKLRGELTALSRKDLGFAALSGFFLAMHFATWISSLDYTSVANSVVLVNTSPLWVALLTPLVTRDKVPWIIYVSIGLSVLGAGIISAGDFATGGKALLGDFLALLGSICLSAYLLMGRNLRVRLSLPAYVFICYGSAAVILWVLVLALGMPFTGFSDRTYMAFLGMAVIAQLLGHTSYNWALKWLSTSVVAICMLGEPIGSTILAYIIFNEGLTWWKWIGGALILAGIYISAMKEKK